MLLGSIFKSLLHGSLDNPYSSGPMRYRQAFLFEGIKTHRADIVYLKARSHEYQMQFKQSSKDYFELASNYPSHPKASIAGDKAERLAEAESDYVLAAKAADLGAKMMKKRQEKLKYYEKSFRHYRSAGDLEASLEAARKKLATARTPNEKLPARVMVANALMAVRSEDIALEEYRKVSRAAVVSRSRLNKSVYSDVYGEVNFHLGEEARIALSDFRIIEREGDLRLTINQKMRYFESMVNYYDRSAKSGHPHWGTKSRFIVGVESELLADELVEVSRVKEPNDDIRNIINQHAQRLRKVARTQYSANLLSQSRDPRSYKNNPWVKKSRLKLGGYLKSKTDFKSEEIGPSAVSLNIPSQWSL